MARILFLFPLVIVRIPSVRILGENAKMNSLSYILLIGQNDAAFYSFFFWRKKHMLSSLFPVHFQQKEVDWPCALLRGTLHVKCLISLPLFCLILCPRIVPF